jgi:DNA gyrase inhibitor GyrI
MPPTAGRSIPAIQQRTDKMADFEARIERLDRMKVASVQAFGENPESEAWRKAEAWAGPLGLLDDLDKHSVFGFNNPAPSPDRTEYGYEFWVAIDSEIEADANIEMKEFGGGLYAVTTCNLSDEINSEFFQKEGYLESWKKLDDWVEQSRFQPGSHQGLEKPQDPSVPETELVLDLYYPIVE